MSKLQETNQKIAEGITEGYQKIEDGVVEGYKKIETGVVTGYKKIETGVVEGFGKITDKLAGAMLNEDGTLKTGGVAEKVTGAFDKIADKFVDTFLTKDGETTEDAKARMANEQKSREEKLAADMEERAAQQKAMIDASLEASRNAGKRN